jgi:hypothetical protein
MIKIERNEKLTIVSSTVTDFTGSMGYCEHRIPFYMEGIKAPTLQTMQGAKAHDEEEELEHEQFVMVPITVEELTDIGKDVEFAREKIFTRLLLPLKIEDENVALLLHGRADKVLRNKQTLIIQDDKFPYNVKKYDAGLSLLMIKSFRRLHILIQNSQMMVVLIQKTGLTFPIKRKRG